MNQSSIYLRSSAFICGCLFLFACTSATQSGHNTALDSVDLVSMTDDMAMKIVASPAVEDAISKDGKLKVVVEPVENDMQAEILPKGPSDAFTARLRVLLAKHAPDKFTWIMNRDAFYNLRSHELEGVDLGPAPGAINPQYALIAKFSSMTNETHKGRNAYYLCTYELTDLSHRTVLWTDKYEVKKSAVRTFLD